MDNYNIKSVNSFFANTALKTIFFQNIDKFKNLFTNPEKNADEEVYKLYLDCIEKMKTWERIYSMLGIPMPEGINDDVKKDDFYVQFNKINYKKCGEPNEKHTVLIKNIKPKYVGEIDYVICKIDTEKGNKYFTADVDGFVDDTNKEIKIYSLYEHNNDNDKKLIDKFISIEQIVNFINEL